LCACSADSNEREGNNGQDSCEDQVEDQGEEESDGEAVGCEAACSEEARPTPLKGTASDRRGLGSSAPPIATGVKKYRPEMHASPACILECGF
jgi:hypothetical protein